MNPMHDNDAVSGDARLVSALPMLLKRGISQLVAEA